MLIDLLYFSLSHLYFSFCVSLEGSLQNICWQVYFLCNVEETWISRFFLTDPKLPEKMQGCRRWHSHHPDCPAHCLHPHITENKLRCSLVENRNLQPAHAIFLFLSLRRVARSSLFRIELLSSEKWTWNAVCFRMSCVSSHLNLSSAPHHPLRMYHISSSVQCWGYKPQWDPTLVVKDLTAQGERYHIILRQSDGSDSANHEACVTWGTWAEGRACLAGVFLCGHSPQILFDSLVLCLMPGKLLQ